MGRPSKLSEQQWGEVLRLAAQGEPQAALSKRFKVSEGTISKRVSKDLEGVKTLAGTIARSETELESLPVSKRIATRTLADQLKQVGTNLARAAVAGSATAAHLSELANRQAGSVTQTSMEALVHVAALTRVANEAAAPALKLVTGNKEQSDDAGGVSVIAAPLDERL